ncbi:MAG: mercury resistance system periplasmic binding protein MerP [Pseudomonadota bacterium]|jgi:mercuric ion binding protein
MRGLTFAAAFGLGVLMSAPAFPATQTVVLEVPSMTCSACPITVRKSLERVPGVLKAKVTYEPKEAVVTYDDSKTSPDALMRATAEAGYPSFIKEGARR